MKYKTLLVSGCSFTHQQNGWAEALAKKYNLNLINLARSGAGNIHIANSIILYLERHNLNVDEVLVGVMWSGCGRIDFLCSLDSLTNINDFKYDEHNKLVISTEWLDSYRVTDSMLKHDPQLKLLEVVYSPGQASRDTQSWLAMTQLSNYLTCKNYTYFQTSFYDYNADVPPGLPFNGVNYTKALNKINLKIDNKNWIQFNHNEYLGNYTYYNKLLHKDRAHPSPAGATQWANECLVPKLVAQGYL